MFHGYTDFELLFLLSECLFHHFLLEFLRQTHVFGHVALHQRLLHGGLHLNDLALHGGGHLLYLFHGCGRGGSQLSGLLLVVVRRQIVDASSIGFPADLRSALAITAFRSSCTSL